MKDINTLDDKSRKEVLHIINLLKDKYTFFGITTKYISQLLSSDIDRLRYDFDNYINEVEEKIYNKIRKDLLDGDKLYYVLFDYIQNNFLYNNNYNDQLINMNNLLNLLKTVKIVPSQEIIERLLFSNIKLCNACKIIFNKNSNFEKNSINDILSVILKIYNNSLNIVEQYLNCDINSIPDSQSAIDIYYSEIKKIPLLSSEEEKKLMILVKEGDRTARKKMAEANLRLVVSIAIKIYNDNKTVMNSMSLGDLISEGNIGLLKAIDRFDPSLGYKFSTYAIWWIRQAILKAIKDKGRMVRIPFHFYPMIKEFRVHYNSLEKELKRPPSIKELASSVGISETKAREILYSVDEPLSINVPISEDSEIGDVIPSSYDLFKEVEKKDLREQLINFIKNSTLSSREKMVILMRNELYDGKKYSLADIAKIWNISYERVSQIESRAYHKLVIGKNRPELEKFLVYLDNPEEAKSYLEEISKKVLPKMHVSRYKAKNSVSFKPLYSYFKKYDRTLFDFIIKKISLKQYLTIKEIYGIDFDKEIIINNPSYTTLNDFNILLNTIENLISRYNKIMNNIDFSKDVMASETGIFIKNNCEYDRLLEHDASAFLIIMQDIQSRLIDYYNKRVCIKNDILYTDDDVSSLLISSYDYSKLIELLNRPLFMSIIRLLNLNCAIIIALKLGYVNDKYYNDDQICAILRISKEEYNNTIDWLIGIYNLNIDNVNKKNSKKIFRMLDK